MIIQPRKYKSEFLHPILVIECRRDRLGNIFYCVEFSKDGEKFNFAFSKLDSALDFVNSNFNKKFIDYDNSRNTK